MREFEFGELFVFIRNGLNVRQDKSGDGVPITRIETISNATVDPAKVGYAGLSLHESENWLLQPGDILFSHINSVEHIGKCAIYDGIPSALVHGMNLLCMRCRQDLLVPEFAKYLIRSIGFRAKLSNFINKAVNQASVSIGNLKGIPVFIPPLPEQRRIAQILDKAEALRAKRRAALEKLYGLAQSIFLEMFGDPATNPNNFPKVELSTLTRLNDNINYGVVQPGDDLEEGVPLIRAGNIVSGSIQMDGIKHISPEIEKQYRRSRLIGDEILVSCVGSIGFVALADSRVAGYNIARAVARIPLSDSVNRQYLAAYLRTEHVQKYFVGELRTVSQPTLNIKQLSETKVILPPFPLQQSFSRRVEAIERLKALYRSSLTKMDTLFASLQHSAFDGEL